MKKTTTKLTAMLLSIVMAISIIPTAFASDMISFSDVSESAWYHDDVMAMTEAGYISGYTDGDFKPDEYITNAELASLFAKAFLGESLKEEVNGYGFLDTVLGEYMTSGTTDYWWAEYVAALGVNNIYNYTTSGLNIEYNPGMEMVDMTNIYNWDNLWASVTANADDNVTRSDVFSMMGNLFYNVTENRTNLRAAYPDLFGADYEEHPLYAIYDKYEAQYSDWDEVTAWQTTVLLEVGIIQGSGSDTLNASGYLTRAEVVTILSRLVDCELIVKDSYEAYAEEVETSAQYDSTVSGSYDMTQYTVPADFNLDGILTEDEVQQMLDQLQEEFPNCSPLGDAIYPSDGYLPNGTGNYAWTAENDGIYYESDVLGAGGDCIAWANYASDRIFGDLPVVYYEPGEWAETDLRIGDVIIDIYHTNIATSDANWDDSENIYWVKTSDSGSGYEITWMDDGAWSSLTRKVSTATLATRYPF